MALRPNENKPESGLRHQYLSHRLLRSLQLKSDMKRLALSIGMALFCQSASAGIYSDCKQAVSNGDIEKATEFATKMLGFNSVSMEHREEGAVLSWQITSYLLEDCASGKKLVSKDDPKDKA